MRKVPLGLAATLALACVVGGCSAHPLRGGPVRLGSTSGNICLPANPTGSYTMGFDLLHNDGTRAVTLDGIRAVGGSGVEVAESYLLPVAKGDGVDLVGVDVWPPEKPPPAWKLKTPAVGPDRLDPSDASLEGWNLVLRLRAAGPGATYDHLAVDYSRRGIAYEAVNEIGLEIRDPC